MKAPEPGDFATAVHGEKIIIGYVEAVHTEDGRACVDLIGFAFRPGERYQNKSPPVVFPWLAAIDDLTVLSLPEDFAVVTETELRRLREAADELREIRRSAVVFETPRVKPLAELKASDIPRGLQPEDVATDFGQAEALPGDLGDLRRTALAYAADDASLVDLANAAKRFSLRPVTPFHALVQCFEDLGAEPCVECGYALNEIRDYVNIVVAAKDLVLSGYDGPFMGEAVAPLFKAVREYEAAKAASDEKGGVK